MIYRFRNFELDCGRYRLLGGGEPVHIEPLALELLVYLIENRERLVSKEELLDTLWADRFVSDAVLARCVHEARQSLGDDSERQRFIETVRGRGYRFAAAVEVIEPDASAGEAKGSSASLLGDWLRHRRRRVAPAALFIVLAGAAVLHFWARAQRGPPAVVDPSIAVLPFVDMSDEQDQGHFGDGLAEELTTALSRIEGLRVVARTSSFSFRDRQVDVQTIGEQLRVATLLEGSVRRSGERLRVTAQLVRTADGSHVWSRRYERQLADIFEIQDDITREILAQLGPRLLPETTGSLVTASTHSPEAYELLFLARQHHQRVTKAGLETAVALLRQAVDIDPRFAQAHAALSEAYTGLLDHAGPDERRELRDRATAAALLAIESDPDYAGGHAALAFVRVHGGWDREGAEAAGRRALELNPGSGTAHYRLGLALLSFPGRADEAVDHLRRAVDLDPFLVNAQSVLGLTLRVAGRYDEAIEQLQRTLELDPNFTPARTWLMEAYRDLGREDEAVEAQIEIYRREGERSPSNAQLAELAEELRRVYAASGTEAVWRRKLEHQLREYRRRQGTALFFRGLGDPMKIGTSYAFLGEWEEALHWWETGIAERHPEGAHLEAMVQSHWPDLFSHPGFIDLLQRTGLRDGGGNAGEAR